MNTMTAAAARPHTGADSRARKLNPWASNTVLMGLSVWWVQSTRPQANDFSDEVAAVFNSLQRELQ